MGFFGLEGNFDLVVLLEGVEGGGCPEGHSAGEDFVVLQGGEEGLVVLHG